MAKRSTLSRHGVARTLLLLAGILFVVGSILHSPWIVSAAVEAARGMFHRAIAIPPSARIRQMQWLFLGVGVAFLLFSWLIGRVPALDKWFRRPTVEKVVLGVLVVILPITWGELSLRAFVPPRDANTTSLFMKDKELGWKLRPGASDTWGGVKVTINERGNRGPVVPYERKPGVHRILWLGDSVTFGYRIARWQDTVPFLADSLLFAMNVPVETVNLAVEGYSQWQEAIVMATEGVKYQPDLVVVGFVLNDVTEMFHLPQFGGAEEGFQMRHTASSWIERVFDRSAIVYEVQNLTREIKAKRRLGQDVRLGAIKQQALDVETLMRHPDQANVKTAWDFALADLQKIADQCQSLGIPLLVVEFPFAVQLDDPQGLGAPQTVLENYAHARGIQTYDLLPYLSAIAGIQPMNPLFLDEDHLSIPGHQVVARLLAPVLANQVQTR